MQKWEYLEVTLIYTKLNEEDETVWTIMRINGKNFRREKPPQPNGIDYMFL